MPLLLNIGRLVNATGHVHTAEAVYAALAAAGLDALSSSHVDSDTEPTIVVEVTSAVDYGIDSRQARAISLVADALDQDCIAVWDPASETGALLGPHPWADGFLPQFFRLLDGRPLSTVGATA